MSWLQIAALAFAFLAPVALWAAHARRPHPDLERRFSRGLALTLALVYLAGLGQQMADGVFDWQHSLPMQLCDWTLFAVVAALIWRSQTCFELAYFWALCGTLQALFTPAIARTLPWYRQVAFFLDHAGIVAGVLFLLLVPRMRPNSLRRVVLYSTVFLCSALAADALTGANYGFLVRQPDTPSMLDLFSHTHWIYVMEIYLVAMLFFTLAYLPWAVVDWRSASRPRSGPSQSSERSGSIPG